MDKQFWHERWENNQIGFHQQEINSYLQLYWSRLQLPAGSTVFVPLCGKSRDMLWLLEQGYKVLGIEISQIAVTDFFQENGLHPEITSVNGIEHWSCDELEILCGDFFSLNVQDVAHCDAVYDRASLIAMPPAMRPAYAKKLQTLFPTPRPILLVTMEYPQHEMEGPPFSVHVDEVHSFYSGRYEINNILTRDILQESPRFKNKGVTAMSERVYLLRPSTG
ncbi:thiopurine S-methyltransferase [Sedimenticola selenatireducens]|uniref:Thiopurine S-methyltransferase n=2 Tax=Sedimenticola selenatireducens TaxID=191960 RepID=A0A2N6CS82_9GAMM|nr:thiopurine S-methyltransferase [Sedimenticola selenatireducens]PLX59942.1 MAG: thiopurine S-methyltransferase [Sedimenticola selenatireducens]